MHRRSYRIQPPRFWRCWLGLFATAGVPGAEDQTQTVSPRATTGGVAVHVHGADASLLQGLAQPSPNLLGHLLVRQSLHSATLP